MKVFNAWFAINHLSSQKSAPNVKKLFVVYVFHNYRIIRKIVLLVRPKNVHIVRINLPKYFSLFRIGFLKISSIILRLDISAKVSRKSKFILGSKSESTIKIVMVWKCIASVIPRKIDLWLWENLIHI